MKATEDRIENYNQQVWFHTPDPFFNPLVLPSWLLPMGLGTERLGFMVP